MPNPVIVPVKGEAAVAPAVMSPNVLPVAAIVAGSKLPSKFKVNQLAGAGSKTKLFGTPPCTEPSVTPKLAPAVTGVSMFEKICEVTNHAPLTRTAMRASLMLAVPLYAAPCHQRKVIGDASAGLKANSVVTES